jgi:hypothetical protein
MQFHLSTILLLFLSNVLAIPVADPSPDSSSPTSPLLDRDNHFNEHDQRGQPKTPPTPPAPPVGCPSQKPIAQNLCTSGSPYCCSGSGSGQVCGPASTTTCTATTICCINTNGVCLSFFGFGLWCEDGDGMNTNFV